MTPQFNWTSEADATVIRMRAEKKPFAAVAVAIGCTERAAEARSYTLRQLGVDVWVGKSAKRRTPELVAQLKELLRQGKSRRVAGAAVGIPEGTVRKWLAADRRAPAPPPSQPGTTDPGSITRNTFRGEWILRPGNPLSWGAITTGTVLDGVGYPR